jgi:hypothetical protein
MEIRTSKKDSSVRRGDHAGERGKGSRGKVSIFGNELLRSRVVCPEACQDGVRRFPRWRLEGGSRKRASYSEIMERRWRHTLQAKPLRRGKTLTPTHPAGAENLHSTLNAETRRAPRLPVAHTQMAWEHTDKITVD